MEKSWLIRQISWLKSSIKQEQKIKFLERMLEVADFVSLYVSVRMWIEMHWLLQVVGSTKLNVQGLMNNELVYKGIRDCFSKTYKEAGFRGLYRGVGMDFKAAALS